MHFNHRILVPVLLMGLQRGRVRVDTFNSGATESQDPFATACGSDMAQAMAARITTASLHEARMEALAVHDIAVRVASGSQHRRFGKGLAAFRLTLQPHVKRPRAPDIPKL